MPLHVPLSLLRSSVARGAPRRIRIPEARRAAVAAVFRERDDGAELLFIERAAHPDDPWSGQIAFPGGREEPDDLDLVGTAVRETREELGLHLDGSHVLGPLDELQAGSRVRIEPLIVHPFAFALEGDAPTPAVPNEEVAAAFWVPLRDVLDPGRRIWFDAHRATVGFQFPAVDLGDGRTLWGLTHRMVFELAARLDLIEDLDALTRPRPRG